MKNREEREKEAVSKILEKFEGIAYIKINGKVVYTR